MQNAFWKKDDINEFINIMRPVLVLFICAVHIPYIAGYTGQAIFSESPQMLFSVYIKDVLARGGVPLLSIVSGYLAFFSYKKYGYRVFFKNKVKSLLFPFIITNMITLAFFLFAQYITDTTIHATKDVDDALSMAQAVLGVNRLPVNGPLYFLRDLFLICCSIAIIDVVARSRIATFVIIVFFIYLNSNQSGLTVSVGDIPVNVLYRLDMIVFFVLGYFLSMHQLKPLKTDAYTAFIGLLFFLSLMLLVAITISIVKPDPGDFFKGRWAIGLFAFCFLPAFIMISYKLMNTMPYKILLRLSPYSYMIFLTHAIFAYLYLKLNQHVGSGMSLESPLYLQVLYFSIYLIGCSLLAVVVRKVVINMRARLSIRPFKHVRAEH